MRAFEGIKALNLIEAVEPYLAADESMIDAHAASVSYMDYLMTCGGYQLRPALPYIPGTDAAVRGGTGSNHAGRSPRKKVGHSPKPENSGVSRAASACSGSLWKRRPRE